MTYEPLESVFNRHNTDKNSLFHNYTRQYDALLQEYRTKPIKYLELGVYNGGSLKAMREALAHATHIVGVDIEPTCTEHADPTRGVYVEIGDATSEEVVQRLTATYGTFDVILDDASHINKDVIKSFELLFPLLNDNGLYIVEDTVCYKHPFYVDQAYDNHLTYFFKYTGHLNQWRHDSTEEGSVRDNCVDPFKIQKKAATPFEQGIDTIQYGVSYVAIKKKVRAHWI
jgi:cephalosporin hydroxylase